MNWKLTFDVDGEEHVLLMPRRLSQRRASKLAAHRLSFETKIRKHRIVLTTIKEA